MERSDKEIPESQKRENQKEGIEESGIIDNEKLDFLINEWKISDIPSVSDFNNPDEKQKEKLTIKTPVNELIDISGNTAKQVITRFRNKTLVIEISDRRFTVNKIIKEDTNSLFSRTKVFDKHWTEPLVNDQNGSRLYFCFYGQSRLIPFHQLGYNEVVSFIIRSAALQDNMVNRQIRLSKMSMEMKKAPSVGWQIMILCLLGGAGIMSIIDEMLEEDNTFDIDIFEAGDENNNNPNNKQNNTVINLDR